MRRRLDMEYRSLWQAVAAADAGVELGAWLGTAFERVAVHRDQAELRLVAERPLEVVHGAPVNVAQHIGAAGDRAVQRAERLTDEGDTAAVVLGADAVLRDQHRLVRG